MSPEEMIIMGANPADANTPAEELARRLQARQERLRLANLDCSIEGRGEHLTSALGGIAYSVVAQPAETK